MSSSESENEFIDVKLTFELVGKAYNAALGHKRVRRNDWAEQERSASIARRAGQASTYPAREDLFQGDDQRSCEQVCQLKAREA